MSKKELTLAIETALQGGSISLLRAGGVELDCWIGAGEISKSEDVLEQIEKILARHGLGKKGIKRIIVSRGPGSYTGVRIGMAIAIGLKKALDCELSAVSVWRGMLLADKETAVCAEKKIIIAVPAGRNQICWQIFNDYQLSKNDEPSPAQFSTIDGFLTICRAREHRTGIKIILHQKLYFDLEKISSNRFAANNILINSGENIAALIGKTEESIEDYMSSQPIYIRDNMLFGGLKNAVE